MEEIIKSLQIGIPSDLAFQKFLDEFNNWWPKEYTWSQDKLKEIRIDGKKDGLCTEIGPHGYRCDWGRVTELSKNKKIELKRQIGTKRQPMPEPGKASDIILVFKASGQVTIVQFKHSNYENHGEGADDYRKMMDGEQGWDYILDAYKNHCGN